VTGKNKILPMILLIEEKAKTKMGAGILPVCKKTGRVLIQKRGKHIVYPNQWATFGGKAEEGETPEQAAIREFREESGFDGRIYDMTKVDTQEKESFVFHNFLAGVADEFPVNTIGKKTDAGHIEVQDAMWVHLDDIPKIKGKIHYGLKRILNTKSKVLHSFVDKYRNKK
jgi:8-oxo-dGTP pyrophosphatase MutT (NUDIX family)